MLHRLVFASTTLLFAPALLAQTAVVRGEVTDGSAAGCYYCTGFEHVVKFVGTRLQSTTVNLLALHGLDVALQGSWNGSSFVVTSAQVTDQTFSISGSGTPGGDFKFSSLGSTGDLAFNFFGFGTAFSVPLPGIAMQLNLNVSRFLGFGVVDDGGEFETDIDIPNLPGLVGLRVFGQGILVPVAGEPFATAIDVKEIAAQ